MADYLSFRLDETFLDSYKLRTPDWGFPIGAGNTLGEHAFIAHYSRVKEDGTRERYWETLRRVIEGAYSIQRDHAITQRLPWNDSTAQASAQEAYALAFDGKWSPPGRGFWAMGTEIVNGRGDASPLFNCSMISTEHIADMDDPSLPFARLMEELMLGIGVGFCTRGAGKLILHQPAGFYPHQVPDSREGWCESVASLLRSFLMPGRKAPLFDYSKIRPAGTPIRGFGGVASGPGILRRLHEQLTSVLGEREGQPITSTDITDIMNMIGKAVVAGNVRRSAEIALGMADDDDFLDLKNWEKNPVRTGPGGWSHLSNNSCIAQSGQDLSHLVPRISVNGEPGIYWLDMAQAYGRLVDPPDYREHRTAGLNPCISGETLVLTTEGLQSAASLTEPFWAVVNGKNYRATASWSSGIKDVVQLVTRQGHEIKLTGEHKVLLADGTWRAAHDLVSGDKISLGCDTCPDDTECDPPLLSPLYAEVQSVLPAAACEVYDLTVDIVHAMTANGIIVANCGEIPLESYEKCNLIETYPTRCKNLQEYLRVLKFAFLYGKSVTLLPVRWPESNEVMIRNRRIGVSMTGVAQFAEERGWSELRRWMDTGYKEIRRRDTQYSEWLGVRESIRVTTVKPSGTVSLLYGVTPGVHWPKERGQYVRTVRDMKGSPFAEAMREAGYLVEPSYSDPDSTVVITFAAEGPDMRAESEVSIWEKTALAAFAQRYWADNSVSCTVTFSENEAGEIPAVLRAFDGQLKSISLLPMTEGVYRQAPYRKVSRDEWEALRAKIRPVNWEALYQGNSLPEPSGGLYCDSDSCEVS